MRHPRCMTYRAAIPAALMLGLTIPGGTRLAFANLAIDWLSCRAEVVSDREGLHLTGREICDLVNVGPGIIFRPVPRLPPQDRICDGKKKKADKAIADAKSRVSGECAKELDGPTHGATTTIAAVAANKSKYNACASAPGGTDAANADANSGPNTLFNFFGPFYGELKKFDHLKPLKTDDLRRQLIVLNLVAIATGRLTTGVGLPVTQLNDALRAKCFTNEEKNPQTFEAGVDENGIGVYPDATTASTDANDGVLGDDGSGQPPVEDVFIADPEGATIPPDYDEGGGDGDDGHLILQ